MLFISHLYPELQLHNACTFRSGLELYNPPEHTCVKDIVLFKGSKSAYMFASYIVTVSVFNIWF